MTAWWQQSSDSVSWTDITPRNVIAPGKTRAWGLPVRHQYLRCVVTGDKKPASLLIGVQQIGTADKIVCGTETANLANVFVIPWKRSDGYYKDISFLNARTTTQYVILAQAADSLCTYIPVKKADGCRIALSSRTDEPVFLWLVDVSSEEGKVMTGIAHINNAAFVDIVFGAALTTQYTAFVTPDSCVDCWVSNKTSTGFRLNTSATGTYAIDWIIKKL